MSLEVAEVARDPPRQPILFKPHTLVARADVLAAATLVPHFSTVLLLDRSGER